MGCCMQRIKTSALVVGLSVWCYLNVPIAEAQAVPAITSTDTVETLLRAENKAIIQRANATNSQGTAPVTPSPQVAPVNRELALLSVYGVSSDLRVDVKYGDFIYAGLAPGQKVGPLQVVSIDGVCVQLSMLQENRRSVRQCWAQPLANRQPTPQPPKSEPVQNAPLPNAMSLPSSLPGVSGFLGLTRGLTPSLPPLPVVPQ